MDSLIINEGCFDDLEFSKKRSDNLIEVRIQDSNMLVNKSEAEQIIKHLQEQFNLPSAPELLEMLITAKDTIQSLKLSMLAHPDCEEGSEFDDYTSTAQEVEDEITELINKACV